MGKKLYLNSAFFHTIIKQLQIFSIINRNNTAHIAVLFLSKININCESKKI